MYVREMEGEGVRGREKWKTTDGTWLGANSSIAFSLVSYMWPKGGKGVQGKEREGEK